MLIVNVVYVETIIKITRLVRILTVKDVYEDAGLRSICWNAVVPTGLLLRPKMILSMTQTYEVEK